MENLKAEFYNKVNKIMWKEMVISNNGVQSLFEEFVLHLEQTMTYPRIINQFTLALKKFKQENGRETKHHLTRIVKWINEQPKNYE